MNRQEMTALLFEAIALGEDKKIDGILDSGFDINGLPLRTVTSRFLLLLIEAGANVNVTDEERISDIALK